MDEIALRLAENHFFSTLEVDTRRAIAAQSQWFCLAGGSILYRQHAPSKAVYFVLSGRMIVARNGAEGQNIIGYVGTGEPVGEMSLILDEPHTATVYALRDAEIIAIDHDQFDALCAEHGDLAIAMSRFILRRSRPPKKPQIEKSSPKVFVLIGSSPSINIDDYADKLTRTIQKDDMSVHLLNEHSNIPDNQTFENLENNHDIIIISTRVGDSPWYRFALRHADRFFVFARRDAVPPKPFPLSPKTNSPARRFRMVDLVMIDEGIKTCPVLEWRNALDAQRIFHWRDDAAIARLARVITGRSIGIVMSGGGARAYAHIGVVRALRQANIPIDFIRRAFVESNPLSDFRLPVISLAAGRIVTERLRNHFGDALIEEFDLPFFCVSADLAKGVEQIHRTGFVREALRASISLPGILPPVVMNDQLLVDGGLINNFPTDIMSLTHRGKNIGVDVARRSTIDPADFINAPGFIEWVMTRGFRSPPPIVSLLMRSATTRRESTMYNHQADISITPEVNGVDLRAWKKYDLAVEEGYKATIKALDEQGDILKF